VVVICILLAAVTIILALTVISLGAVLPGILILPCGLGFVAQTLVTEKRRNDRRREWNEAVYPRLFGEWERKWVCLRCGTAFEVSTARGVAPERPVRYVLESPRKF
jgi:hypothetical protein